MEQVARFADPIARALMALIFILSGIGKIGAYEATQGYMEAFGLPGFLLAPTIAFEIAAGAGVLIGFQTRILALLLCGFSIASAMIFHADFGDQVQQVMFLKNVAMAGGFMLLAKAGAPGLSVDQLLAARKGA